MKKIFIILISLISFLSYSQKQYVDAVFFGEVTTTQRNALIVPVDRYPLIYNITNNRYEYWDGDSWESFGSGSDLSNYVTLDGSQTITGTKNFNVSGGGSNIVITNTDAGYGLYLLNSGTNHGMYIGNGVDDKSGINVYNNATTNGNALFASNSSNTGNAIFSQSSFSGTGIYSNISGTGDGIVSNGDNDSTGNIYVGKNNGTNTFTVSKTGVVTANSFIGDGSGLTGIVGSGFDPSLNQTITGDWIFNGAVALDFVNFTSSPDFGNNTLTGVANGTASDEAVNKAQLDAVAATIPTSVNTASTLVAYNATVSDAYTSAQPNRHITLAGNSDITVTGGVSGDTGLWYLYGTGTATLNNTDASTLVVPVSGDLKVVYFLVDKDDNLTWYQDENSGGSGAVAVQTATGDGATNINWTVSPFMDFTFGAFNEIITMTPPTYPERLRLKLTQDGVGSRTVTWGNDIYVPSGTLPTLSIGANDTDVINLFWNGVDFELDEDFLDYTLVAGVDVENPTAPTLASGTVAETTVDLSWSGATDNVAVTGYKVYVGGILETTLGNVLNYQVTGLTGSTSYDFNVRALDAAGNESINSNTVNVTTSAPTIDYAAAFIAAGSFSASEQTIIQNFVDSLELSPTLISKIHVFYPLIGTTEPNQKLNLLNPADTNAAFRLTSVGTSYTRDAVGVIRGGAGSSNYLDTNYNFFVNGTANNLHIAFYSLTTTSSSGHVEFGANDGTNRIMFDIEEGGAGNTNFDAYGFGSGRVAFNTTDAGGLFIGNRENATSNELWEDGVLLASNATSQNTHPNLTTYLLAVNNNGSSVNASSIKLGAFGIGLGLTDAEIAVYTNAINYLITAKQAL